MSMNADYEPQFSGFHDLMKFRVKEILLVSSLYDAFVLEEDGRLSERIFSEYVDLNLRFIPRIKRVSTAEHAFEVLKKKKFDLIITMTRIADMNPLEFGKRVKELEPDLPVILLTFENLDPRFLEKIRQERSIDNVFYWAGDTKILLAIIKYVEDKINVEEDCKAGVQVILIIEDNPLFYSMFLPIIYTEIMTQTRNLISEGVNDLHRLLRMRARPKILLAETYEEAIEIYEANKQNLLGIISDIRFPRSGELDPNAGFILVQKVRSEVPDLPVLLQSNEDKYADMARGYGAFFLNKNSENLLSELRQFILWNFGFGDFVFRYPDGREIGRARNLMEFEKMIRLIPEESLEYHSVRNHISIWLRARTEFELANDIRPKKVSDFRNINELRNYIANAIRRLINKNQFGVVTDFGHSKLDLDNAFIRLGNGSLGGKGRGIAFMNALLAQTNFDEKYPRVKIKIPHTFAICTEVFEEFVEKNDLLNFAINVNDDLAIARKFKSCELPVAIVKDLRTLLEKVTYPLAVRSSSVLEDSPTMPFAGLYKTYMIPNNHPDINVRLRQLSDAIKLVYASVYYKAPKEYVRNTAYRIEEEKMGVIIQQLGGEKYGEHFYPVVSGVAQSYNYYPTSQLRPEDGIVHMALGLGKSVVDGEKIYRFSPAYPGKNQPYSSPAEFLKKSQSHFYALHLANTAVELDLDEEITLRQLDLSCAEEDGVLYFVGSSYSVNDQAIRDTLAHPGPRVVTFANILKYGIFPLSEILMDLLELGKKSFGTHVEIEFALNLYREKRRLPSFLFLQIRPLVAGGESAEVVLDSIPQEEVFCASEHALGNGVYKELYDLVYVDPETFNSAQSRQIAREIEWINQQFIQENRNYVLIGFGRWGTADPWLGIPVKWDQVSQARVLVESSLDHFSVEPSQGSHFFHNLVSLRLGYLHINRFGDQEFIIWPWLKRQPIFRKTEHVCHVRFSSPVIVKIDGRSSRGVILKPGSPAEV